MVAKRAYSNELVVGALSTEYQSTTDIANAVGCSYVTALNRLKELSANGKISSKRVGKWFMWKLQDAEDE